jgi:hypothetical protein
MNVIRIGDLHSAKAERRLDLPNAPDALRGLTKAVADARSEFARQSEAYRGAQAAQQQFAADRADYERSLYQGYQEAQNRQGTPPANPVAANPVYPLMTVTGGPSPLTQNVPTGIMPPGIHEIPQVSPPFAPSSPGVTAGPGGVAPAAPGAAPTPSEALGATLSSSVPASFTTAPAFH